MTGSMKKSTRVASEAVARMMRIGLLSGAAARAAAPTIMVQAKGRRRG